MKFSEIFLNLQPLKESERGLSKDDEIRWQDNPSGKTYWVKGKSKEGKDRRWGPFKNKDDASKFKHSRSDIKNSQVAFE